jgi:putative peptidoglycan lipid II flippase
MLPALLGVSVAQLSLLINTQIASHMTPGSVSWLSYADLLMEFPTAMLGVALGVVLLPQLSAAQAANEGERYSGLLDWGLRLVVVLGVPAALALLVFAEPLVAVLYHYGAFTARDVIQTSHALMGYGVGLLGLVAIKVLAPGFYARQDIRTPVKIAIVVLVLTQLLNLLLVPHFAHAGLALAIGLGALVNASWLLVGLLRRGAFVPLPGWGRLLLQVGVASAIMAGGLWWVEQSFDWVQVDGRRWLRLAWVTASVVGAVVVYLGLLRALGVSWRALIRK